MNPFFWQGNACEVAHIFNFYLHTCFLQTMHSSRFNLTKIVDLSGKGLSVFFYNEKASRRNDFNDLKVGSVTFLFTASHTDLSAASHAVVFRIRLTSRGTNQDLPVFISIDWFAVK